MPALAAPPGAILITVAQVAMKYGVGERTIWRWEEEGRIPRRKVSEPKNVKWLLSEVDTHIEAGMPVVDAAKADAAKAARTA